MPQCEADGEERQLLISNAALQCRVIVSVIYGGPFFSFGPFASVFVFFCVIHGVGGSCWSVAVGKNQKSSVIDAQTSVSERKRTDGVFFNSTYLFDVRELEAGPGWTSPLTGGFAPHKKKSMGVSPLRIEAVIPSPVWEIALFLYVLRSDATP